MVKGTPYHGNRDIVPQRFGALPPIPLKGMKQNSASSRPIAASDVFS
jgi:hypothetical protein